MKKQLFIVDCYKILAQKSVWWYVSFTIDIFISFKLKTESRTLVSRKFERNEKIVPIAAFSAVYTYIFPFWEKHVCRYLYWKR